MVPSLYSTIVTITALAASSAEHFHSDAFIERIPRVFHHDSGAMGCVKGHAFSGFPTRGI